MKHEAQEDDLTGSIQNRENFEHIEERERIRR